MLDEKHRSYEIYAIENLKRIIYKEIVNNKHKL